MNIPVNPVSPQGFLLDWLLLGPFNSEWKGERLREGAPASALDRDFLAPLGGEAEAVLSPETVVPYVTEAGLSRTARAQRIGPAFEDPARPDFNHLLDGRHILEQDHDQATAYAFCYLESPRAQRCYAYLGADGSPRVWLNGQVVYEARARIGVGVIGKRRPEQATAGS